MLTYLNKLIHNFSSFELLTGWSIVKISGLDHKKYLQNHVTFDINKFKYQKHILCANCNAQGRVNSILRLIYNQSSFFYIQRSSISNLQVSELMKYAVFSKVKIEKLNHYFFISIIGMQAKSILLSYFSQVPNNEVSVVFVKDTIMLWFDKPIDHFLIIVKKKILLDLKKILLKNKISNIKNHLLFLNIISNVPIFEKAAFQRFFPHDLNLDRLGGISFNKGCYCGQEMISKMHFKNINNKKLFCLIGKANIIVDIFLVVEMYNQGIWKKIGHTLFSLCIIKNNFIIQCVLKKNAIHGNQFRLALDQSSSFSIFQIDLFK